MNEYKKYGLYLRKSSEDSGKQIASIENQSQVLKEKAIKENLKIVNEVYEDANILDEVYDKCKFDSELKINISSIEMDEKELEEIYNIDLPDNFRLKFLKTA